MRKTTVLIIIGALVAVAAAPGWAWNSGLLENDTDYSASDWVQSPILVDACADVTWVEAEIWGETDGFSGAWQMGIQDPDGKSYFGPPGGEWQSDLGLPASSWNEELYIDGMFNGSDSEGNWLHYWNLPATGTVTITKWQLQVWGTRQVELSLDATSCNSVDLYWECSDPGDATYELQWADNPGFTGASGFETTGDTTCTVGGLDPCTPYYFRTRSLGEVIDPVGTLQDGAWSNTISAETLGAPPAGGGESPELATWLLLMGTAGAGAIARRRKRS